MKKMGTMLGLILLTSFSFQKAIAQAPAVSNNGDTIVLPTVPCTDKNLVEGQYCDDGGRLSILAATKAANGASKLQSHVLSSIEMTTYIRNAQAIQGVKSCSASTAVLDYCVDSLGRLSQVMSPGKYRTAALSEIQAKLASDATVAKTKTDNQALVDFCSGLEKRITDRTSEVLDWHQKASDADRRVSDPAKKHLAMLEAVDTGDCIIHSASDVKKPIWGFCLPNCFLLAAESCEKITNAAQSKGVNYNNPDSYCPDCKKVSTGAKAVLRSPENDTITRSLSIPPERPADIAK